MHVFDSGNRLVGNEEDSLERKLSVAVVEQILQRRAEEVLDQYVEVAFLSKPVDSGYSHAAGQRLVRRLLFLEGPGIVSDMRGLHGYVVSGQKIGSCYG